MNLEFIFDELCKGNLALASTTDAYQCISNNAIDILRPEKGYNTNNVKRRIELICQICNILYNRTDLTVMPISDQLYDDLMNLYKLLDPNFQVGSVVVNFSDQAEKNTKKEEEEGIDPLTIKQYEERDEIRQYYADRIMSFDQKDRFTYDEVFGEKIPLWSDGDISKRVHDTTHNHPQLVGTLDKAKFVLDSDAMEMDLYDDPSTSILERDFFWNHIKNGIIKEDQELQMVLELKYDGISVEADCTDIIVSARTRGDTGVGKASDITPILYGYRFPRNKVLTDKEVGVKFEAVIKYTDLMALNAIRGTDYVNARMAINGIMNSSDGYKYRDLITLIPLAIDRDDVPEVKNRMEEIELLNSLFRTKGEPLRYCFIQGDYKTCLFLIKKFVEEAKYARQYLNFMFDGVVVSYLDEDIRNKLGRENYINKYTIAVKFDPLSVLTTFLGYEFTVGQSGNITPMIYYSPVEFIGTIHNHSSGSSVKRFNNLALKLGDIIEVTYNNDVMPYVRKVDNEHNRQNPNIPEVFPSICPCCGTPLEFSKSGNSAKCPNWYCKARVNARLTATLDKLGIVGIAGESVRALQNNSELWIERSVKTKTCEESSLYNIYQLFDCNEDEFNKALGSADSELLYNQLLKLRNNTLVLDSIYFGALGFTDIGKTTWKKIFSVFDSREIYSVLSDFYKSFINVEDYDFSSEDDIEEFKKFKELAGIKYESLFHNLLMINGIGESTVDTIMNEWKYFFYDMAWFFEGEFDSPVFIHDLQMSDKKIIRFSGVRKRELEELLCKMGHDADGKAGVTKETDILIIPYDDYHSTKTEKMSAEAQIVSLINFIVGFDSYIDCEGYDEEEIFNTLNHVAKSFGVELTKF